MFFDRLIAAVIVIAGALLAFVAGVTVGAGACEAQCADRVEACSALVAVDRTSHVEPPCSP